MTTIGNHSKLVMSKNLRLKSQEFFTTVLGCKEIPGSSDSLATFKFNDGFSCVVVYVPDSEALPEETYLKSIWLEIMVDDPKEVISKLKAFGAKEIDYTDKAHYYFQAPGGQVFRIAPESERK